MIEKAARERRLEANVKRFKEREQQCKLLSLRVERLRAVASAGPWLKDESGWLRAHTSKWETHPWLLGTSQGVIDLRTGTLRAGQPDDHLPAVIPTEWKGLDEPAPRFQQFLRAIFSERAEVEREELLAFLQRVLGYGITGHVNEQIFLLFYEAKGSDGKGLLMQVLEHVLGKTVGEISSAQLLCEDNALSPASAGVSLGSLRGKRLLCFRESEARLPGEQIKQLSAGKEILIRQPYARAYSCAPSHLLLLLTSYRPKADAADSTYWERLCPLVCAMSGPAKPELAAELAQSPDLYANLAAEASGILAWLVRGALAWQHLGLAIPASVLKARQEYRYTVNSTLDFIKQCCLLDPEARVLERQLYKRYKRWASANELVPSNNKQFADELKQIAALTWQRDKRGNAYRGLRLRAAGGSEE